MTNLFKKLFGRKKTEVQNEEPKETFTSIEMREVLEAWNDVVESQRPVTKILVVNNKSFGSNRRGDVLNVEWYEGEYIKGYKEVTVGGVYTIPTSIEDLQESNILYVPYF